jgi:major vault protein
LLISKAKKFKEIVDAIGANTIKAMAQAGPEMQVKLLQSLGLKSFMITDGHSPINLFNTASGLIAGGMEQ